MRKFNESDFHWMKIALEEAEKAMEFGEIPVATILVAGNAELTRSQTMVRRHDSITAHGELIALMEAKSKIWTSERPLVIYTTLEPCLMCLGASLQTGVDEIIFGMKADPDGGTRFVEDINKRGQVSPLVIGGLMEQEEVKLMRKFLDMHPNSPAIPYVKSMLAVY